MPDPVPARASKAPSARDAVALAFEEIGGVSALAAWVEASDDNRKVFYATIYPKILSLQLAEEPEMRMFDEVRWTIVAP